ncbi:MAG TPA: tRNA (adenosine(37)-N6)-threonylcarbamoyltransferase complex dimerization subunit type 1 TsaB [Candidatus Limnocylindrales bacterium]|jgi:tRNA threonylcarbamoyladenosine biosynthesis protein TsaB|nr:tRNA (adenosine(37)-N6)-threonylcarbamoyltransferase complex dimerization subunit type 1 TsaB [Candidatus Limnocylindrales bacterium]
MIPLPVLAIDTATSRTVARLVMGGAPGGPRFGRDVVAARHGGELLPAIEACFAEAGRGVEALGAVVVGTGPGSFTGVRIGMAAAKTIAYARRLPILGVPTPVALAAATLAAEGGLGRAADLLVVQPAGPSDRYVTRIRWTPGEPDAAGEARLAYEVTEGPRIAPPREDLVEALGGAVLVAIDLDADLSSGDEARQRSRRALEGLGDALLDVGLARLERSQQDDVSELVPAYVTLPRGVEEAAAAVAWAPELG